MPRTKSSRKYQLTINNPLDHGFDHETIKTAIQGFSGCVYWCLCDEVGEQGTPHTHLYMAFKNAKEFQSIHQHFYGAHIEIARGTHQENRDYIRKEGRHQESEKAETNLPETFEESGELPEESDRRASQSEAIFSMVVAGSTNAEILREYPTAMTRLAHIEATRQTLLEEKYRRKWRDVHVTYIYGETGVGKTRSVMERYGYDGVYRVTNYAHPFDNYTGQDIMLFDEFRSSLPISDMLKYLDGYPVMLPCRYSDRVACFTKVYVVSNIPFEAQYPNIQVDEHETWAAFSRRFSNIFELLSDADIEGVFHA